VVVALFLRAESAHIVSAGLAQVLAALQAGVLWGFDRLPISPQIGGYFFQLHAKGNQYGIQSPNRGRSLSRLPALERPHLTV
jgi:hypothetical protein